ncbi:hypothetical protein TNCV_4972031 [Trichonephila clavipes]|nr:hypothetical protein TNCV_4972031 [Trichonephila clavipes]
MARSKVPEWHRSLKECRESVEYNERVARPSISRTEENVALVSECVRKDHRQTFEQIAEWYWARSHDMPTLIRYLDHWATAALKERRRVNRRQADTEVSVIISEAIGVSVRRSDFSTGRGHQCCGIDR